MNKHQKAIYGRLFAAFVLIAVVFSAQASGYFADTGQQRSEWVKNQLTPAVVTPIFNVPVQVLPVYPVEVNLTRAGYEPEAEVKCRSPGNVKDKF